MGRALNKLSSAAIRNAKEPGLYGDGGGLWLHVGPARQDAETGKPIPPGKSWIFRYMLNGKAREMGLGGVAGFSRSTRTLGLAAARDEAEKAREKLARGLDPLEERREEERRRQIEAAKAMTFRQCAEAYMDAHRSGWRNAKHASQWETTLETYAYPLLGDLPVQAVDTDTVLKVIQPLWTTKTETASRLRGRIEAVLDWATAAKFRGGDNPARWAGNFEHLLPARSKVAKVEHHSALPYAEICNFLCALRDQGGIAARALEFTVLTAARTGETIGAKWGEFDADHKMWTVPGDRMKAGKEHRVPLSGRALEILREMAKFGNGDGYVFPGQKEGAPLSNMAFLMLLRRMGRGDLTAHGFRSTFRDWAAERSSFPAEVAEMALAHTVGDKVEAAYRRGDLLQKRRQLAEAWAKFCAAPATNGTVTPINPGRAAQ